jgi:hypothetical protein
VSQVNRWAKYLQNKACLFQIDGDQDPTQVVKELRRCIHREIGSLRRERAVEAIPENGKKEGIHSFDWIFLFFAFIIPLEFFLTI